MEMNHLVFSKQYGFGRIVGFKDEFVVTLFLKVGQKSILKTFLEEVDQEFVDLIVNSDFMSAFPSAVIKRSFSYANSSNISSIFFHDNTLKAVVIGTDDYYTSLSFMDHKLSFNCSCPVVGNCKHEAGLCFYLKEIFDSLLSLQAKDNEDHQQLTEEIKQQIDRYVANRSALSDAVYYILKDVIDHLSGKYIQNLFIHLTHIPSYRANFYPIYRALGFNDKTRNALMDILNDISRFGFYSDLKGAIGLGNRLSAEVKNSFSKIDDYNVDYYFYNEMYESFILSFFTNNTYYFRYDALLPKAIELAEMTNNIYFGLKRFVNEGKRVDSEAVRMLIEKLSTEQKVDLYTDPRSNLRPTYKQVSDFSDEVKIKLLPTVSIVNSEIPMVLNDLQHMEMEPISLAKILCRLSDCSSSIINSERIGELSGKLPNGEILKEYLLGGFIASNTIANRYQREYQALNRSMSFDHKEAILDYFETDVKIEEYNEDYIIRYSLNSLTGKRVFLCELDSEDCYCCLQNEITGTFKNEFVDQVVNLLDEKYRDEINEKTAEIKARIRKQKLKEKYAILNHDILNIQQQFSNTAIQLNSDRKASIEYHFNYENDKIYLGIKIGIDKGYIVKNIYDFLNKFALEETERYGKNLVLTHKPGNFRSPDDEVLRLLTLFKFEREYYGESKYLQINSSLFDKILILLKGGTIYFNNDQYKVTLKNHEPEVYIDENYILHYSLANERYETIHIANYLYVLDKQQHCFDRVSCTNKEVALYALANNSNESEIKEMIEPFKDTVYTRFADKIVVAEELKEEFKLSILTINAYFDYADKKIILKSEYVKNDQVLDYQQITKQDDLNKIDLYQQYLSGIGFVEDELKDDAKVLAFFSMDLSELKEHCSVYLSETIKNKQIISFTPKAIRIVYENNMMQAFYEQSEYSDEELEKIIKAIRRNKKYVQLTGNRIIDISQSSSKEFVEAVDDIGLNHAHLSGRNEISVINALKGYAHNENVSADSYLTNMIKDIKSFKKSDLMIPEIEGELRNYQKDGYRWMKILSDYHMGGILADDMGLGKTIQVICLIKGNDETKPNLIVCPKSLVFNWKNEFARFAKEEKVVEIYGGKEDRVSIISKISPEEKVTYITSYDSLRNDCDEYKCDFNHLIIDEAQYIKNVTAMKTMSVKAIKGSHKFALTGTPIENNIIDLWSIFDFIMPGYLDDLSIFKSNYNNYQEYTDLIKKRIAPFILRRTKENVLKDLPEKFERVLTAEMSVAQRKLYDAMARQAREMMKVSKGSFDVLPYLTRLRQICVDPRTFTADFTDVSGKMDLLEETVKQYVADGHKIIIFSQFVKALNLVEQRLKVNKLPYFMITGETEGKQRIEIAESFNSDSKEKVCLISLKAGGTGLNLIGADTVIHLDPWWNVSAENQATDRTHRIGQTKTVEVIKMICANSIEQRVIELQNIKKDLIDKLISNDESSVTSVSLEDIRFILE